MALTRKERAKYSLKRFSNKNFICHLIAMPIFGITNLFSKIGRAISGNGKKLGLSFVALLFFPVFSSFSFMDVQINDTPEWSIDFGVLEHSVSLANSLETDLDTLKKNADGEQISEDKEYLPDYTELVDADMLASDVHADTEVVDVSGDYDIEAVDTTGGDLFLIDDFYGVNDGDEDGNTNQVQLSDYISDETYEDYEFSADDWRLILVNKSHFIPKDYEVPLADISDIYQCDERILDDLIAMFQAAKTDGVNLSIRSPYRTSEYQTELFNYKIVKYMNSGMSYYEAYKVAGQAVTIPGTSEHEIGLSIDIVSDTYTWLEEGFADNYGGIWLAENAHYFGFILRYPADKEYITTIEFEPWHYRYVGVEAATVMYNENLTLEEFWEKYLE